MAITLGLFFAVALQRGGVASGYPASTPGSTPTGGSVQSNYQVFLPMVINSVLSSHYMKQFYGDYNANTIGQTDAVENFPTIQAGNRTDIILDYGQPCLASGGAQGAYSFTGTCYSTSQIKTDVESYIQGYCTYMKTTVSGTTCGTQYQSIPPRAVVILVGTNNCCDTTVSNAHGRAWSQMVVDLNAYLVSNAIDYQLEVKGATDIELQWNSAANSKAWVDGYNTVSTDWGYYNFGDCPCSEGYNPGYGLPLDWHYEDVWYVSWGSSFGAEPFPEIYNTTGAQAREWQGVSHYAYVTHGSQILFQHILTQLGACNQGLSCVGVNNSKSAAFTQMNVALNADPDTAGGLDVGPLFSQADISWYPRP
jgi:hypothetical protein